MPPQNYINNNLGLFSYINGNFDKFTVNCFYQLVNYDWYKIIAMTFKLFDIKNFILK